MKDTEDTVFVSPHALFVAVMREMDPLGRVEVQGSLDHLKLLFTSNITLFVSCNGHGHRNKGRAVISYSRPRGKNGAWVEVYKNHDKVSDPSITVSLEKSPEQIANDISRRLWSEACDVQTLVHERIEADKKFVDGRALLTKKVSDILSVLPSTDYRTGELTYEVDPLRGKLDKYGKYGYGKVTINSADSIDIEFKSLGADFGCKVLWAIAKVIADEKKA